MGQSGNNLTPNNRKNNFNNHDKMKNSKENTPWSSRFPWWAVIALCIAVPGTIYVFQYDWSDNFVRNTAVGFMCSVDLFCLILGYMEWKRMNQ